MKLASCLFILGSTLFAETPAPKKVEAPKLPLTVEISPAGQSALRLKSLELNNLELQLFLLYKLDPAIYTLDLDHAVFVLNKTETPAAEPDKKK